MTKSWLTETLSDRERERKLKLLGDEYEYAFVGYNEAEVERAIKAEDNLGELIENAEDLMADAGFALNAAPRALVEMKNYALATKGDSSKDKRMHLMGLCIRASEDLHATLYNAREVLIGAKQMRDHGNVEGALHLTVLAAQGLIRSVALTFATQRRNGGAQKAIKNPEARAKSKAIRESQALWLEREAGRHPRLRTEDQFAMEVAHRWPIIASISAIKKRSSQWRRDAKEKRTR